MTAFADPIEWESTLAVRPSSPAWRATVKALYGSPLDDEELALFRELAGREPPEGGADEFLAVAGRRAGKSETIARLAVFEAVHGGHNVALAPGQLGLIPVISPLREQSGEIVRYCHGLAALPQVRPFVDGEPTRDGLRFLTGVEIRTLTADAVNVSGPTVVLAVLDELARFPGDDAAMPDREILASLRPALAPLAGAPRRRLIGITSAYIRDGVGFETDRDHFAREDADVLVVRGSTAAFNPSIDAAWLERERRRVGSRVFAREYLAEWQDAIDSEGFFPLDAIEAAVDRGVTDRAPDPGVRYVISIDPAFSGDMFAISVVHAEYRPRAAPLLVVDAVAAFAPPRRGELSAEECLESVRHLCEDYRQWSVLTDQGSRQALISVARPLGITLVDRSWSSANKAPRFRIVRDALVSRRVRLLDQAMLLSQFSAMRGELLRSGVERIEASRGHDDLVDAVVLGLAEASRSPSASPGSSDGRLDAARESALRSLAGRFSDEGLDHETRMLTDARYRDAVDDGHDLHVPARDVIFRSDDSRRR